MLVNKGRREGREEERREGRRVSGGREGERERRKGRVRGGKEEGKEGKKEKKAAKRKAVESLKCLSTYFCTFSANLIFFEITNTCNQTPLQLLWLPKSIYSRSS